MRQYLKGNVSPRYANVDLTECCKQFEEEVDDGNFMQAEGRPLLVIGQGSREEVLRWNACLARANYDVFRTTPIEALRFLAIDYKPDPDDEPGKDFASAQCFIILDALDPDTTGAMTLREKAAFIQFVKSGVDDGIVFVFEAGTRDLDPDILGSNFGEYILEHFEAVELSDGKNTPAATSDKVSGKPDGDSEHDRAETPVGNSGSRRSNRIKKRKP